MRIIIITFCFILLRVEYGNAGVKLVTKDTSQQSEITQSPGKTIKQPFLIKKIPNQITTNSALKNIKNQWYELHGILNSNYVYLLVEKSNDNQVAGYLFDGEGGEEYIYGEWFEGQLQVYDKSNNRLTVIIRD